MSQDHRNGQTFTCNDRLFECWVVESGRFEWRSSDGSMAVGRNGSATCWGKFQGRFVGHDFPSLKAAMVACISQSIRARHAS